MANEDLTGDGVPELVVAGGTSSLEPALYVMGCASGSYATLLVEGTQYEYVSTITAIRDMNADGVDELVLDGTYCHWCVGARVYEWDGSKFSSLITGGMAAGGTTGHDDEAGLDGYASVRVADIDGNGTAELILEGGIPSYPSGLAGVDGPYRAQQAIWTWDGAHFVPYSQVFDPPRFRFEALQDADRATQRGQFDKALDLYQQVIFSDKLRSWTRSVWDELAFKQTRAVPPDPSAMPYNPTEYSQLAAYSRYRIMILHYRRGFVAEAETVYSTLLRKFPKGNAGFPYVDLATSFANEYSASANLASACDAAIEYAAQHPEILVPLGNDHGYFVAYYTPKTICPFR